MKMREMSFPWAFVVGLTLVVLSVQAPAFGLPPRETGVTCNCYRLDDMCPASCPGCTCDPMRGGDCGLDGKLDVNCSPPPNPTPQSNPSNLVNALDLYIEAYMVPIGNGAGRPDASLFDAAARVNLGAENQRMHGLLEDTIHTALDAVIGFDIALPRIANIQCEAPASDRGVGRSKTGNVRGTPPESVAIVEATHEGLRNAILTRNLNAVVPPLTAFWTAHPDFHPSHTGRYYPHGHSEYEGITPLEGQIRVLKQSLLFLLNNGQPLCGNDVREGPEVCDGSDSIACGGVCGADCACGIIP